jgi:hypothetical protein
VVEHFDVMLNWQHSSEEMRLLQHQSNNASIHTLCELLFETELFDSVLVSLKYTRTGFITQVDGFPLARSWGTSNFASSP